MLQKILTLLLFSAVKFIWAFPLARYEFRFHIAETFLITTAGGFLGVLFFSFIWDFLISMWFKVYHNMVNHHIGEKFVPQFLKKRYSRKKQVFTRKNKRYVKVKQKFGIIGIAVLTPVLFSIPIGTFLAIRFYKRKMSTMVYLFGSVCFWSLIICLGMFIFNLKFPV